MTAEDRLALRQAIDARMRERLAYALTERNAETRARRARLLAACGPCVSPVRRENQVRSVLRMLDQQARKGHGL